MSTTPRLINLPAPPSDPVTPSDMGPGTPNSTTTSLSGISTTAIKDGHQGNVRSRTRRKHRGSSASDMSTTTLDAERADRISRLAGLEPVATVTPVGDSSLNTQTGNVHSSGGYFDNSVFAHLMKERSTVGSASATGSVGRSTWASGSDLFDTDRIGDEDGTSSIGGFSDENASLVGFGEGANSTLSGPVSTAPPRTTTLLSRQASATTAESSPANRSSSHSVPSYTQQSLADLEPVIPSPTGSNTPEPRSTTISRNDARMVDGMTFDADVLDTTNRPAPAVNSGQEVQESEGGHAESSGVTR
ncbi:hypothetical protein VTO42DRAFT_4600 [Malbranchea cinnamomea]